MLFLSSHPEQSKKRKNKVKQNIRFILSHFKEPIFPRTISSRSTTYDRTQFKVAYSEKEMFRIYEQSKFIDCRVSIYSSSYAQEPLDDQRIADLIIFNVYKPIFMRENSQIKALYVILDAIKKILAGKPTILRSTSSFHIYQPIEPHPLEQIKQFIDHIIRQYPELQLILKFPGHIFDSCNSMLLIPGTFDSGIEKRKKEDEEIMLIQKWDGYRPRMVSPVLDFLRPYIRCDHHADSKAFLLCKSCFWCASNLSSKKVITKCPMCDNNALLNSIPISDKEVYEIDSSQSRIKMEPGEYCANVTT